jgi:hypothetical protein
MGPIFISHSEKDLHIVNEIIKSLEDAGYQTWYFKRDVVPTRMTEAVSRIPVPHQTPRWQEPRFRAYHGGRTQDGKNPSKPDTV